MSDKIAISSYSKIIERQDTGYERIVTSIVADPENIDTYGGSIEFDVIERAMFKFMETYRNYGIDHVKDFNNEPVNRNESISLLENWMTRNEQEINGVIVPKGAWVQTWRVNDGDIWERIISGDLNGFSFVARAKKRWVENE